MTEIMFQNKKTIENLCATIAYQLDMPLKKSSVIERKSQQEHINRGCQKAKTFHQGQNFLQTPPPKSYYQQDYNSLQGND